MENQHFPTLSACDLFNRHQKEESYVVHDLKDLLNDDIYIPKHPHRHAFYQILYIKKGKGIHRVDFQDLPIEDGMLFFLSPGQVHDLIFEAHNPEGMLINFREDFFNDFLSRHNFIDTLPLFSKNGKKCYYKIRNYQQDIAGIFEKTAKFNQKKPNYSTELVKVLLLELLLLISSEIKSSGEMPVNSSQINLVKNFEELLEKHFMEAHYPKFYAEHLAVTPNYLNAVCREITGKTAGEIIRNRITLEAKRLLVNSQLSISQIAYDLYFEDNSYFTKFFKASSGISPNAFRKTLNK